MIDKRNKECENDPKHLRFKLRSDDGTFNEVLSYNKIIDHIIWDQEETEDPGAVMWKFKAIIGHKGPLNQGHRSYKGSSFNVLIEWEDGSRTYEPLDIIASNDPVTCAIYAKEQNLLDIPGWKRFKRLASREQKMKRMLNQSKLQTSHMYMFGVKVPQNAEEALQFDKENGNTKWEDSMFLERSQLFDYNTFIDLEKGTKTPQGCTNIKLHMVFTVKHDG